MDHKTILQSLFISNFSSTRGMLHAARASIGALPMIAKALLAKANKPIRIIVDQRADTGSTDCESYIRLPPVPMPKDDDDVEGCIDVAAVYYGLIHHEVGHCNHTDISDFRNARQGLERALVNIIEDVRMENVHIRELPAARPYLDALSIVMSKNGRMTVPPRDSHPGCIFTSYVMFRINALYRNEPVSKANLAEMTTLMEAVFTPGLTQRLDELLEETPKLTDTRGAFSLARKVIALIQDERQNAEQSPPPPPSDAPEQSEADDQGKGEEDTQDADSDAQSEPSDSTSQPQEQSDADADSQGNQDTDSADPDASGDSSTAESDSDEQSPAEDEADGSGNADSDAESDDDTDAQANAEAKDDSEGDANDEGSDDASNADASADADGNSDGSSGSDDSQGASSNAKATADASGDTPGTTGSSSSDQGSMESDSDMPDSLHDRLNSLLSTTDDTGSDRHESANQMLQQLVQELAQKIHESLNIEDAIQDLMDSENDTEVDDSRLRTGADHDLNAAYSTALHIRRKLLSELDAVTNSDQFIGQRGSRLSSRHLHRVMSGDGRVFKTKTDGIAPSTAVMLVQDVSGSMYGEPVRIASQALYASAIALEGIDGIEVGAMAFPGNGLVLDFGDSPRAKQDSFQLTCWGSTPMGQGIHVALHGLLAQPQDRKLMIVLTDGEPDNDALARSMIAAAEVHGVEVIGIGILTDSVQHLFSRWMVISDINDLPEQLVALVRDEVMQSIAA